LHGGGDPADLPGLLDRLATLRKEHGTVDNPFEVHVISLDAYTPDGVRKLEEPRRHRRDRRLPLAYGVEQDTESLQTKIDNLRRFADDVIAKLA